MSNYAPPTTPIGGPSGQQFPPQQSYPPPPQKKSNALVWVLAGCGTLILIGIIVVVLGMYFVRNIAKQAGVDPELMRKNPALGVAKMSVTMDKDLELISIDEDKSTITFKNKKTGETITLTAEQDENGRVVFKQNGKEVTLEARSKNGKGTLEVKSKDGSAKFGNVSVDKLPDWLPAYPDVEVAGIYSAQDKTGESGGFHFTTQDSPRKVLSFYEAGLKRAGMVVTTNVVEKNGKEADGILSGEGKKHTAYVNAAASEQGTEVTVMFATKE